MSNGSKREQIYQCGWLWQTGYYAKTKRKEERGMREGWEYICFESCLNKIPKAKQVKTKEYNSGTKYPIISQEDKLISGYCDDESMLFHIDKPVIIFGDHTRVLKYIDFDFVVGADGVKIISPKENLNAKFLLYFLTWYNIPNLGYSRHYKLLKELDIPVPPLSTQLSIVSELDKINELIRLKREQLKDYDNLAQSIFYEMFGDPVVNEKGWIVKTIGDVCSLKSGDSKANKSPKGTLPYVKVGDMNLPGNENYITCSSTYVDRDYNKRGIFPIGSILFPKRGGAILTNKKRMAAVEICCDLNTMGVIPSEVLNKHYLFQWFKILDLGTICSGSTILQLNNCDIAPLLIQIPPLTLQQTFAQRIELIEKQKAEIQSTIADLETLLASRMQYWFD